MMGDHSKAGINSCSIPLLVVGVGVTYTVGFSSEFVASFSEGGAAGFSDVQLPKFYSIAERMMARRGKTLTDVDKDILEAIYNQTESLR